jgi:UDP-glucose 4-epimerase
MSLVHLNSKPDIPKRVVVVGAGGFVGGAVAAALKALNVPLLAIGRGEVDLRADTGGEQLASLLRADDSVVAAAAIAPVKNMEMFEANARLVRNLVGAFERQPVAHLLNIGSDAIYADSSAPLTENSTMAPDNLHGVMHLFRDVALRNLANIPYASLRPTLIYGRRDPHNGYGPNRFRRLAEAGETIVLFGNGEERRDHVLVGDVADLAVRILMRRSTGTLNAATGHVASFREIAEKIVTLSRGNSTVESSPRRGPMPHAGYRPFDPAAVATAFPDFIFTPLDTGLARVQAETGEG